MEEIFFAQNETNIFFMTILMGWAAINIAVSALAFFVVKRKTETFYFLLMNFLFNLVNLVIGAASHAALSANFTIQADAQFVIENSIAVENILIFNSGLDLVYISIGAFMYLNNAAKNQQLLKGFGLSVIIQGSFLFILDLVAYISNQVFTNQIIEKILIG